MYLYKIKKQLMFYSVFRNLISCHKKELFRQQRQVEGQCHEIFFTGFASKICEWFSGAAMQLQNASTRNVNVKQRLSAIRLKCRKES